MKRLSLGSAKRMIALVILTAAAALPLYGQEMQTSLIDADQTTSSRFALSAGETPAVPENHSANPETLANPDTLAFPDTGATAKAASAAQAPSAAQTPSASQTPTPTPSASPSTSTSYVFPTGDERRNRYVKSTVGPFSLLRIGLSAGINQWRDNPEEWEQGMSGFGKRYASGFGRNAIQQTVIYGLDSAMGLDTGFKRSTRTGFFPRMKDALAENITSRTRTGKRVISVPRIAGVYSSRIIAYEAWYPESYSYRDGLRSGTRSLITGFGMNLIREFVVKF